jgi:hypothetical protein
MLISAEDLIKSSIDLYKKHFRMFIEYSILVYAPPIITAGISYFLLTYMLWAGTILTYVLSIILTLAGGIISFWFSISFFRIIATCREGKAPKSIKLEINTALKLLWPAILASIIAGLAVLGGFVLLIVPGIIFSLWFSFTLLAVALDNKKGVDALRVSKKLVSGRWWGVLWRILLPGLLYLVVSFVVELPFEILANVSPSITTVAIATIVTAITTLVITPFITTVHTILYLELKKVPVKKAEISE